MQVIFSKSATKSLRGMPRKDADAMIAKLELYASSGSGDVVKLLGEPFHRLRHGNWRAIFEIDGDILVVRIAHRREVYE